MSLKDQIQTSAQDTKSEPKSDCSLCPRLVDFRNANIATYPSYFNGAVGSFGDTDVRLLVIGMAPGLKGANRTARPFTGDGAGDLLYEQLHKHSLAKGIYDKRRDDGFTLVDTMVTNAVRCVPPENKPIGSEIANCRPFLIARIESLKNLKVMLTLGKIAHDTTLRTFGLKLKDYPFTHGGIHNLPNGLIMVDSYHCSRYNVNTRRLTAEMFSNVMVICKDHM